MQELLKVGFEVALGVALVYSILATICIFIMAHKLKKCKAKCHVRGTFYT